LCLQVLQRTSPKEEGVRLANTIYEDARTSGNWFVVSAMGREAGQLKQKKYNSYTGTTFILSQRPITGKRKNMLRIPRNLISIRFWNGMKVTRTIDELAENGRLVIAVDCYSIGVFEKLVQIFIGNLIFYLILI